MPKPKVETKAVLDLVGVEDEDWAHVIDEWLSYKRDRKQSYKTERSAALMVRKLFKMSNDNPDIGREIVEISIMNNWSGLFELKPWQMDKFNEKRKIEQGNREDTRADYF